MKIMRTAIGLFFIGTAASAAPIQWSGATGGNDHYYELIVGTFSFAESLAAAESSTYLGLTGHLVTITSAEEQAFLDGAFGSDSTNDSELAASIYWIGASDSGTEGEWRWVSGPESGT